MAERNAECANVAFEPTVDHFVLAARLVLNSVPSCP